MKRFILLTIIAILFCSACSAQPKLENSLLWKISGNGLVEDSYLFGTCHGVCYTFLDSVDGVWNAYNSVKTLVVEVDPTSKSNAQSFLNNLAKEDIFLPKDSTYKVLYNNEDYKFVDEYMSSHGFGYLSGVNVKPAFMGMIIYSMMINSDIQNIESSRENNMEPYMSNMAKKNNKKIVELDKKIKLEKLFASIFNFSAPLKEQAKSLLELLKIEREILKTREEIEQYYKECNLEYMTILNKRAYDIIPNEFYMLLDYRNDIWMESIPQILKSGSCFIAVGVRHLVGEDGLINLLRKAGYIVEPVVNDKNTTHSKEQDVDMFAEMISDAQGIPFELYHDQIYIDATIADSVKSKLIFDTGCDFYWEKNETEKTR